MSPLARRMKLPFLICTFLFPLSLSLSLFLWFSFLFHRDLIESRDFLFCSKAKLYTFFIAGSVKFLKHKEHQRRDREKTNKIINRSATVTVHICTITVAIVHNYAQASVGVFLLKLCKIDHFFHFAQLYTS